MAEIFLKAEGEAFEDGKYDLRVVEVMLNSYRRILDHTVPYSVGHKTLSEKMKSNVRYEMQIRQGSIEILIDFILENPDLISKQLPILGVLSADGGSALAKSVSMMIDGVVKLRRLWADLLEKNQQPSLSSQPQINLELNNVDNKGGVINVNPIIITAAEGTKAPVDQLIRNVDGTRVEYIQVGNKDNKEPTKIVKKDKTLLGTQREELPNYIELPGKLDVVNYTSKKGRIRTGNGTYPVSWSENIRSKIHEIADNDGIVFRVQPIIDHRKFHDDPIGFHIVDCWDPQNKLL